MRTPAVVGLLVAVVLAGCLSLPEAPGGSTSTRSLVPFATLRCGVGTRPAEAATSPACNPMAGTQGPGNEVTVAVDPTDPANVVAASKDYTLGDDSTCGPNRVWSGIYVSKDGGRTWTNMLFDGYPGGPEDPALSGFECNTDPVLAFAGDGTLYFSGLAYGGQAASEDGNRQGSAIWVARSEDGGMTWSDAHVVASSSDAAVFHDKQWMAVGPEENVYVTWSAFVFPGDNLPDADPAYEAVCDATARADRPCYTDQILVSRSGDGGETWTEPRVLFEDPAPTLEKQFSTPAVGADGTVYVTWIAEEDPTDAIHFTRSTDGGETWTPTRAIFEVDRLPDSLPNTEFRVSTYPVLAVDRTDDGGDRLALTWAGYERGHSDVYYAESANGGETWTEPVRVHRDATDSDQFMPWVDVAPTGEVHLAWMDRRHDPGNRLIDIHHATSGDGTNFTGSTRITPVSFDGDEGFHQSGSRFIGDYIGVAAHRDVAYVAWPDTRNATPGGEADGSWVRVAALLR